LLLFFLPFLLLAFVSVFFMGREYLTHQLRAIAKSVNRLRHFVINCRTIFSVV
jgi:hypothetical protein